MEPAGGATPRRGSISRFLVGAVSLAVLSALATLALWAVAYPMMRGWTPTAVVSGSMAPSINVGDILVAAPIDADRLGPGAIIVFDDPSGPGFVTHRVVEWTTDGDLVTRGDANANADSTQIRPDQVHGIGRLVVPLVGLPHSWAANGQWLRLFAAAMFVAVALWSTRWAMLDEFDPWSAGPAGRMERAGPTPRHRGAFQPAAVPVASVLLCGVLAGSTIAARAGFVDPSESGTNSITAAAVFP